MKYLYKYPQREFPYERPRRDEPARGSREEFEYELLDTGIFDDDRYFDVFVEYAKDGPDDILIRITVHNRGPEAARLHLLPTLWFRNTWSWGDEARRSPSLREDGRAPSCASHPELGELRALLRWRAGAALHREREQHPALWGQPNASPYVKDAFHRVRRLRRERRRQPGEDGDEGRGPLRRSTCRRAAARSSGCASAAGAGNGAVRRASTRRSQARIAEADEFYDADHAAIADRGRAPRPPPGAGGDAVEQAVLLLRSSTAGSRSTTRTRSSRRRAQRRPQHRVVPHAQRRRHLHARQVGVPVVRGLGPRVPHDCPVARRLRLRQGAAAAHAAQPVQPSQRADARLRVELQRREPAGARLGDAVPLQVRAEPGPRGHPRSWSARSRA